MKLRPHPNGIVIAFRHPFLAVAASEVLDIGVDFLKNTNMYDHTVEWTRFACPSHTTMCCPLKLLQKKLDRQKTKVEKGKGTQRVSLNARFFGLACPGILMYRPLIVSHSHLESCSRLGFATLCLVYAPLRSVRSSPLIPMIVLRRPPIICMHYPVPAHWSRCMR